MWPIFAFDRKGNAYDRWEIAVSIVTLIHDVVSHRDVMYHTDVNRMPMLFVMAILSVVEMCFLVE